MENNKPKLTDQEVQQRYANASKTFGRALGHEKAHRNERRRDYWYSVLEERGLEVDTNVVGHFNGEGSA